MGGALVKQAIGSAEYRSVNDKARLVLVRMALIAHDAPHGSNPSRWYFESRMGTAEALGYILIPPGEPGGTTDEAEAGHNAARLAVRRSIRALVAAGAIVRRSDVDRHHLVHTGRQEEYFVMVGLSPSERNDYLVQWRPVDNGEERGAPQAPQSGQHTNPSSGERGAPRVHTGVQPVYPQGDH